MHQSLEVGHEGDLVPRECHRLSWGFPGQPVPMHMGMGFDRIWVMGLVKPMVCITGTAHMPKL